MNTVYHRHSIRAKKARLARQWTRHGNVVTIQAVTALSAAAGVVLIFFFGLSMSFVFIPAVIGFMMLAWTYGELKDLKATIDLSSDTLNIHEALDARILGRAGKLDTPQDIWQAVRGAWRQKFFSVRYGLGTDIFDQFLSSDPADSEKVWRVALELAKQEEQDSISAAALTVALMSTIPGYEEYLAHLRIEPADLIEGIDWQRHIELVAKGFSESKTWGGIARDWTAGYTPMLNRMATNMSFQIQQQGGVLYREGGAGEGMIDTMVQILAKPGRTNVGLIGEVGMGKTSIVNALAQRLMLGGNELPNEVRYNQVFVLNASTLMAQVTERNTLEAVVLQMLAEAHAAKNIILFFDEAQLFFQQETGAIDLSNVLLPVLERGGIRIILAMGSGDWQTLVAKNQTLASLVNQINMPTLNEHEVMRIMEDQVVLMEYQHSVTFMYQALREAYRLADRYIHDVAFPGKAIRVLEAAVNKAEGGVLVTEKSVQESMESTLGVKVQTANVDEKKQLMNLEDEIHKRMINQSRAVSVVSDALRRARSGVNNPNKPVGTFMFLGPTGVGKTELSKAVAEVYFGGEDNIIRVDMNEYVQSSDVARLLVPSGENATGLLAQIKKQPFSVVLFDEIEKAHPDVVNIFLQLLDEGVMRDTNNKEVSFRDAIIIATSNAGADQIRAYIEQGHKLEDFEKQFIDNLIDANLFKPEFLNRFDEITVFRPLSMDELLQVTDLLIAGVNKTLSRQKVQVKLTHGAKEWLVQKGYDPRLGARPLRRTVQRTVENIVARKLLSDEFKPGTTLELTKEDLESSTSQSHV